MTDEAGALAMHPADMAHVLRMMSEGLGETLRVERYRRGLSIHMMSTECQSLGLALKDTALSSWERQERWPNRESCQALSIWLAHSAVQPTVNKTERAVCSKVIRMVMTSTTYLGDVTMVIEAKPSGRPIHHLAG